MSFLAPWTALIAAAISIPLLLLLYFLRLRRQQLRIPSTLLWQKSFEDLQANAPFQRLRWSMLLILQLLLLAALLLALAEPVLQGRAAASTRVVLLIDRSASMNAILPGDQKDDGPRTRLDAAKDAARQMIDALGERGQPTQMMIIAFGWSAQVIASFESNRDALRDALDSIEPADEQANLDAALKLAGALAGSGEEPLEEPPDVVLLSDGGVAPTEQAARHSLPAGTFSFRQVVPGISSEGVKGEAAAVAATHNLGIVSLGVRREYDEPASVLVFARMINVGPAPVETVATLLLEGQPVAAIRKTIPAASEGGPGEQSITHALEIAGSGMLTLRHNHADQLAADDTAQIVVPAAARPRIALIYPDGAGKPDEFLREILQASEPQRLDVLSAAAYANLDARELDAGALYDLIVFDRVPAARLPGVASLTFGAVPAGVAMMPPPEQDSAGGSILSWDRQHPIMRNVSLDSIVFADFGAYELPAAGTALAHGPRGPVMALLRRRGANHILVGFELIKSNWPLHVSFAVFMQNAIDHVTKIDAGPSGLARRPGETLTVRAAPGARELVIEEALGGQPQARLSVEPGSLVTLPALRRAGLYLVRGAAPPHDRIALSVLSDVESDIRPRSALTVNAESFAAGRAERSAPQPLWPWLIAAAFALMILEWLVYCRRLRG